RAGDMIGTPSRGRCTIFSILCRRRELPLWRNRDSFSAEKRFNHGFHGWARIRIVFFNPCPSVKSVVKKLFRSPSHCLAERGGAFVEPISHDPATGAEFG